MNLRNILQTYEVKIKACFKQAGHSYDRPPCGVNLFEKNGIVKKKKKKKCAILEGLLTCMKVL